jgi:WD40 repeat protein
VEHSSAVIARPMARERQSSVFALLLVPLSALATSQAEPRNERAVFRGHVIRGLPKIVDAVCFFPDGKTVASAGGNLVKVWRLRGGAEVASFDDFQLGIAGIAFSPDGKAFATTGFKAAPRIYETATWKIRHKLVEDDESTRWVAFSPDSKNLATVGFGGQITFWDVVTGKRQKALAPGLKSLHAIAFSPDGKTLAASGTDDVILFDVDKDKPLVKLEGHKGLVYRLAFSRDGNALVTADSSLSATIIVWDVRARKPKLELDGDKTLVRRVGGIALSPDGSTLAIVGFSPYVHLWDLDEGREWCRLGMAGLGVEMDAVAFSPDGETIVAGCADGAVRVWDVPKRKLEKKLPKK